MPPHFCPTLSGLLSFKLKRTSASARAACPHPHPTPSWRRADDTTPTRGSVLRSGVRQRVAAAPPDPLPVNHLDTAVGRCHAPALSGATPLLPLSEVGLEAGCLARLRQRVSHTGPSLPPPQARF
ncbi:MAG: hypothetical protein WDW38_006862 [Sanguina aurantia]